ncbi:MAG: tRNA pseudouridine(38-40) synthase TruA, partial [Chlamydiia bacterium]
MHLQLTVAYDGGSFLGWQETKEGPSIQGTLRSCVEQVTGSPAKVEGASRTDAGVHAWGQIVSIRCEDRYPADRLIYSLQCLLPETIAIRGWSEASESFHPSLDAIGKEYRYQVSLIRQPLLRHQVWTLPDTELNLSKMREATTILLGEHDFHAFATDHVHMPIKDPRCRLDRLEITTPSNGMIEIALCGNRFLYKMCRTLAGTLVDIGRGRLSLKDVKAALESGRREQTGICAPAAGLCLMRVLLSEDNP